MKNNNSATVPLVSVIVATYKRKESLKTALESLKNQSYENIEVIVVDDNADETWNKTVQCIFQEFNEDKRFIYLKNETNIGSAKTRNEGIKLAKGEYVTFLDDDDIYLPEKIENQVKLMIEKNADYSTTDLFFYNEDGSIAEYRTRRFLQDVKQSDLMKIHIMYHISGNDTLMFRRSFILDIGGFEPIDVGDEYYLIHKAIQAKGIFAYLPRCDVKAYIHTGEGGLSSGQQKIDGENRLFEFKKKYFDCLDKKSLRYVRMRHYAVIAFAYLRIGKIHYVLLNGVKSFICSPYQCIKLIVERKKA